jgi:hypothetical protein
MTVKAVVPAFNFHKARTAPLALLNAWVFASSTMVPVPLWKVSVRRVNAVVFTPLTTIVVEPVKTSVLVVCEE